MVRAGADTDRSGSKTPHSEKKNPIVNISSIVTQSSEDFEFVSLFTKKNYFSGILWVDESF